MDTNTSSPIPTLPIPPVARGWAIAGGIAMMLLGFFALSYEMITTAVAATFIGCILMFGSAFQLVKLFTIGGWKNHLWYAVVAIAYGVAGYVFIAHPFQAAIAFTLFLGWAILIGGIFRAFLAFKMRHHRGGRGFFSAPSFRSSLADLSSRSGPRLVSTSWDSSSAWNLSLPESVGSVWVSPQRKTAKIQAHHSW
jgi:hypothetical protein